MKLQSFEEKLCRSIYKFYPLYSKTGRGKIDIRTFDTLGNNCIWCSKIEYFNDPYEGIGHYYGFDKDVETRLITIAWCCILMFELYCLLQDLPAIFTEDAHWLDVFKNSAIITVIASVGAYALRIMVKLALSAYHLSRDAKERYTLSYFYLALKNESAVSDNERAIILNSLFSRADTGLLKGDSAPVMSGDIVSLINKLDKN